MSRLKRSIETYRAMDPRAVVAGSQTQSHHAIADLRHDLLVLTKAMADVRDRLFDDDAVGAFSIIDSLLGEPG